MTRVTGGEYRSFRIASQILKMLSLFRAVFLIRHNLGTWGKNAFFHCGRLSHALGILPLPTKCQ